jgi:hypothetical protein
MSWEAPSQCHFGRQSRHPRQSRKAISLILDTSEGADSGGHTLTWLKISGALHTGYGVAPQVSIRWYSAWVLWLRGYCGDWPVAPLKGQSGCGGESCVRPRRVARSGRQGRWCFRRVPASLSRTMPVKVISSGLQVSEDPKPREG